MTDATLPSNIKAEQALLGILLFNNAAFEQVPDSFKAAHFYDAFHQQLYAAMTDALAMGQPAEPLMLAERFSHDEGFAARGGLPYLADLMERSPAADNTAGYAQVIYDLAMRRGLIQIAQEAHQAADRDRELPAPAIIEAVERKLFDLTSTERSSGLRGFSDYLTRVIEDAAQAYMEEGTLAGLSTGLHDLDTKIGGLQPEDLIILAGRPAMGKTALAMNIAFHVARNFEWERAADGSVKVLKGGRVAVFSLEMSGEQLSRRLLAEASGIPANRILAGDFDITEFSRVRDASMEIQAAPLYIDATGAIPLATLATRARRMKRTTGLDLIVVDYLQLVSTSTSRRQSPSERVSEVTQGLKALAKDLHVPIIALSQLSRDVDKREDKRPGLTDLRDSGSIEQDADVVAFCYRHEYYEERNEPKADTVEHIDWEDRMDKCRGLAEVIIGKIRQGKIGTVKLAFNGELTKFSDRVKVSPGEGFASRGDG